MSRYSDLICHTAAVRVAAPAATAFAFMADGLQLGRWALGCWNTEAIGPDTFTGASLFDGGRGVVRIRAQPDLLLVDYLVGPDAGSLKQQNSARIVSGEQLGWDASVSVVNLFAWRTADMSAAAWQRICATHDAEILLIQAWLGEPKE